MSSRDEDRDRSKRSKRSKRSSEPSSSSQPGSSSSRAPAAEPRSPRRSQASGPRVQEYITDDTFPGGERPLHVELMTEDEQRDWHVWRWMSKAPQIKEDGERRRDEAIQRQNAAREKARAEQEQRQRYEEMVQSTQAASLSPPVARTPAPRAASTANQSPAAAPSQDPYRRDLERMMRETDEVLGNRSSQPSAAASSFFQPANSGGQSSAPGQQQRRNADPRAHPNADPAQQYPPGYNDAWPRGAMPMHLGLLSKEEEKEIIEHQRKRKNEEKARRQRGEQQQYAQPNAQAAPSNRPPPVPSHRHGLPQGTFARTVPGAGFNVQPDRPLAPPVAQQYAPPAHAQAGSGQALYPKQPVSPRRQPYSGYLQPGQTSYPNAPFMPQQQLSSGSAQPAQPAQPISPSSGSSVPTTPQSQRVPGSGTPFRGYRRRNHRPSRDSQFGVIGPKDPFLELTYGEAT